VPLSLYRGCQSVCQPPFIKEEQIGSAGLSVTFCRPIFICSLCVTPLTLSMHKDIQLYKCYMYLYLTDMICTMIVHVGGRESSTSQTVLRLSALQRHRTENSKQISWKYINRSQIHERGNWERGCAVSLLGIHKSDLLCSVYVSTRQI
jgi:hypothetical protein